MPNPPLIVAHRGASHDAPENTLAAFLLAWMQGADAIEADFQLTKDGAIVCVHDPETGRTSNRNMVVEKSSLEALRGLDAGSWYAARWKNQRIPTLDEVVTSVPDKKQLFLEIKSGPAIVKPLEKILTKLDKNGAKVVIMSSDPDTLLLTRSALPSHRSLLLINRRRPLVGKNWQPSQDQIIEELQRSRADGVNCNSHGLLHDASLAKKLVDTGKELHTWTVNRPKNAATLAKHGVTSITTDRPGWLRQKLAFRAQA